MPCPHCAATAMLEQPRRTALRYRTSRCRTCRRGFNKRTGTSFTQRQTPTSVVLLVILWRLRYKLSLRDLAEIFIERGFSCMYEAVRDWEARFALLLAAQLRAKRRGNTGTKWHADETISESTGAGAPCTAPSCGRAVSRTCLSRTRDLDAAQRFFAQALDVISHAPERVTTDGRDAYPRAIRATLESEVHHRLSRYKDNRIEQAHHGIKQRYVPCAASGVSCQRTLVHWVRGATPVFPTAHETGRVGLAGHATPPVPGPLGGGADRVGRRLTISTASFVLSAVALCLLQHRPNSDATARGWRLRAGASSWRHLRRPFYYPHRPEATKYRYSSAGVTEGSQKGSHRERKKIIAGCRGRRRCLKAAILTLHTTRALHGCVASGGGGAAGAST